MKELDEEDFIPNEKGKHPFRSWLIWGIFFFLLLWFGHLVFQKMSSTEKPPRSFLDVSNREFSLFLWQFPEHMRVNAKRKAGYLTGFQYDPKISLELEATEEDVVAPPELLFLYHTWHRFLSQNIQPASIPSTEFVEFLNYAEEWKPQHWPDAPEEYIAFFDQLAKVLPSIDLAENPAIPKSVRQAFLGWRNFFKQGDAIQAIQITPDLLAQFLEHNPEYKRPIWRNLQISYLNPTIPSFLRVAIYNWQNH